MKGYIKNRIKELLHEQMIDGQEMNTHLQSLCNTMTVKNYNEVIGRIIAAIGPQDKNPELWARIEKPLKMLKSANFELNNEKKRYNMTGDSVADEADTYWSTIQSTLCEQGEDFQE
mgnify:CR=1 FL=1